MCFRAHQLCAILDDDPVVAYNQCVRTKGDKSMTVKEIIKMLTSDGWQLKATKGSHLQYVHPIKPGKVTLPNHKGDLPPGTLNSVMKQAGLK
jgi:predicted RNA binding protein YcfA (HicA-like mRNA interferase family)